MSSSATKPPTIAIALGDPSGIGPEVVLKAIAAEFDSDDARYLLVGDGTLIRGAAAHLGLHSPIAQLHSQGRLHIIEPDESTHHGTGFLKQGSADAARRAICWLKAGAQLCLNNEAQALLTAPVNKAAIINSGEKDFVGQTELLSALAGTDRTAMMLLGHDDRGRWLRVALATIHVPIARVASSLKREKIELAIELASQACADLGLPRRRVAVCGLNPHAGEDGKIGDEEITIIRPAVEAARSHGLDVAGPLAADTLFHHAFRGEFDAVVAMYHDQGLAPLKMIAFDSGVNWTLGLPFIRTSPDHGTAYDIAGKGIANPSSTIAALRLAKQLAQRR